MKFEHKDIITELFDRVIIDSKAHWEARLSLVLKPKPKWLPLFLYKKLLNLILVQERLVTEL